ncbi:MAG: ACP S-malonyltransferase [Acetobacteraceae bacterium]
MVGQCAFVFPGQGSQSVGMGRALYEAFPAAKEVFQEVDEALQQRLSTLMFEGDPDELTRTENAQPALMAVSLAVLRVLQKEAGWQLAEKARVVAGHSLGEYSALAAAGSISLTDVARLLRIRGRAMQKAVPPGEGAMAALIGVTAAEALEICEEARRHVDASGHAILEVANDNGGGQVVISGHKAAIEASLNCAKERGVKRAVILPVSAPFHCSLMQPAADVMADALAEQDFTAPHVPLIANVTASEVTDPAMIRKLLIQQVTGSVRWRETIESLPEKDVSVVVEIGAGKVLSGLTRRINSELTACNAATPQDIDALLRVI